MHAGVTGWQSMTWKPCSGSGASVFRHWPEWNAGSQQDMPFWQVIAEASLAAETVALVREMERWMVPNELPGGSVMRQTITQITRKQPE